MAEIFNNQRVLGVHMVTDGALIYNDQPVRGVVMISDARAIYNGMPVTPVQSGGTPVPPSGFIYSLDNDNSIALDDDGARGMEAA